MSGTMRDLDVLAYQLRLSNECGDDGKAFDRVVEALNQGAKYRVIAEDAALQLPLRRLVWKVIRPTESFTVADVTARLGLIGAVWPSNKVSNALGYWVNRGRLERLRKGAYRWQPAVLGGVAPLDVRESEAS